MLTESLSYLRQSDEWLKTVLLGGVFALLGFLVVPSLFVVGYLVRVLRATMHGEERPPVFDEWGDLAVDGLKGTVVAVVYGFVPLLIGGSVMVLGGGLAALGDASAIGGFFVMLVGGLVATLLSLLAAYVVPAATANFVERDSLGAAFDIGELREVLTSGTYATGWLTAFAVVVGAGLVAGALNVVPVLGTVVGVFVGFYGAVAAYYVLGRTWADVHPVEVRGERPSDEHERSVV